MDAQVQEANNIENNNSLIISFCDITSSSKDEALFFLESHNWDLDAAVSTFFDNSAAVNPISPSPISPAQSPSQLQSRSRSPSRSPSPASRQAPYELRSRRGKEKKPAKASGSRLRGIRTFADLNRDDESGSDSDEAQEYYAGGEKSGMLVQDPTRSNNVDAIFNQAKQSGGVLPADYRPPSSSKTFTGKARLLSGETVPSPAPRPPEVVTHTVTFWRQGFTIDDGPLRQWDDPENTSFLESITRSECPKELQPADRRTTVHVSLMRRDEDYHEPEKPKVPFQGVGRTLAAETTVASVADPTVQATSLNAAPPPTMGLVVDQSLPSTSIQLRLADGTRMVSRFNYHHTIRDIRDFIDASRFGEPRTYQLQTVGFPPKQLADLDQTIEQAGLSSSVVIQKF